MTNSILDSRKKISELDQDNVLGSAEQLADQIDHVWAEHNKIQASIPADEIQNIVVSGMGGSSLGAHVIQTLYRDQLKQPLELTRGYSLPGFVNSHTLVVLSSYSGTTEETLATAKEAEAKGAKIAVITAGGELHKLAEQHNYPEYFIDPKYNPSNQPRMAIGYSVFGQLALFHAIGLLSVRDEEVNSVTQMLRRNVPHLAPESIDNNPAKYLAYSAVDKGIVLVSAEHLEGAAHVFGNQINENGKNFTSLMVLPEMNHHALESLSFPSQLKDDVLFFMVQSSLYHPRVRKRIPLTLDIIEQQGMHGETIHAVSPTKLEQVWEIIQLGAYTNLYLAMLNGVNPGPIPFVDQFKEQLGKA